MKIFKNQLTLNLVKRDAETYNMEKLNAQIIKVLTKAFKHVLTLEGSKTFLKNNEPEIREILIIKCNFNEVIPEMQDALQKAIILEMTQAKEETVELSYNGEVQLLHKKDYINYK